MPTELEINAMCETVGTAVFELYTKYVKNVPVPMILAGISGALAACAVASNMRRDQVISAINSAFDDIEGT